MTTRLAPILLAASLLSACQTRTMPAPMPQGGYGGPVTSYPAPYPDPYSQPAPYAAPMPAQSDARYRAVGTEPFWSLDIGSQMVFNGADVAVPVVEATPQKVTGIAGESYFTPRIRLNIVHAPCSDGMSDRSYPDVVTINVDGRDFRGCGADIGFYQRVGENGAPISPPPGTITPATGNGQVYAAANTRWRVARIDGRAVPPTYTIAFDDQRITGKVGCNNFGGAYTQSGDQVRVAAVLRTEMACPLLADEDAVMKMFRNPMTFTVRDGKMLLSNADATLELVRAKD